MKALVVSSFLCSWVAVSCAPAVTGVAVVAVGLTEAQCDSILEDFEKGSVPNTAREWAGLGLAFEHRYRTRNDLEARESAVEAFTEAIERDADLGVAHLHAADLLWEAGLEQRAQIHYRRMLELYPQHPRRDLFAKRSAEANAAARGEER